MYAHALFLMKCLTYHHVDMLRSKYFCGTKPNKTTNKRFVQIVPFSLRSDVHLPPRGIRFSLSSSEKVPLRTFAAGSLVLSFPMTWFTDSSLDKTEIFWVLSIWQIERFDFLFSCFSLVAFAALYSFLCICPLYSY